MCFYLDRIIPRRVGLMGVDLVLGQFFQAFHIRMRSLSIRIVYSTYIAGGPLWKVSTQLPEGTRVTYIYYADD